MQKNVESKITYNKKYEKAPFVFFFFTQLLMVVGGISCIKFNYPFSLMFIPFVFGIISVGISLFLLSDNYGKTDFERHERASKFKSVETGLVTWMSKGRHFTILRGEFEIQKAKIIFEDRFRNWDGMNEIQVGDQILVKFNPENLQEFVLCRLV